MNSSQHRTSLMNSLFRGALFLIACLIVIIVFYAGPRIEVLLYPVMGNFTITDVQVDSQERAAFISGVLYKNRGQCVPLALNVEVYDTNSSAKVGVITMESTSAGEGTILRHRPSGAQDWGPWKVVPPPPPLGAIMKIVITHRCHFLWTTEQILYQGPTQDIFPEDFINGAPA